jgi:[ribosomal protein S18]-alanine N-acetyltransferase
MADWHGHATVPGGDEPASEHAFSARLRPMAVSDLADVIALEHELFPEDPWSAEMFANEIAQPADTRLYLVAEPGLSEPRHLRTGSAEACAGQPTMTGYAGLMFVPGGRTADVLTIAVRQAYWGAGIGSALLGALLAAARERRCAEVFLEVRADNPRAQGLYARRGFAEIGIRRGYYQPSGTDAIVMLKDLRAADRPCLVRPLPVWV